MENNMNMQEPMKVKDNSRLRKIANDMMQKEDRVWTKLNISSGSELYQNQDKQRDYFTLMRNSIDKFFGYYNFTKEEKKELEEILENYNRHSLNNYIGLKGFYEKKDQKAYIDFHSKMSYAFLNPSNVGSEINSISSLDTITKEEWNKKQKDSKLKTEDGKYYIMQYDDKIGTYLKEVNVVDNNMKHEDKVLFTDKRGFKVVEGTNIPLVVLHDNGTYYMYKSYIPYDYTSSTIVYFVSGKNGDEFGQFATKEQAEKKYYELSNSKMSHGGEIKVGDKVGNTVQGFDFVVLKNDGKFLEVKNINTGKIVKTFSENMYKSNYADGGEIKEYAVYELYLGQPYNFWNEEDKKWYWSEPQKATLYTKNESEEKREELMTPRRDIYSKKGDYYKEIHIGNLYQKGLLKKMADGGELESKKQNLIQYLNWFPYNAKSWGQATDELRDIARMARMTYLEVDEKEYPALDFKKLKTPSEWNTEGRLYITDMYFRMSDKAKKEFLENFEETFENKESHENYKKSLSSKDKMAKGGNVNEAKILFTINDDKIDELLSSSNLNYEFMDDDGYLLSEKDFEKFKVMVSDKGYDDDKIFVSDYYYAKGGKTLNEELNFEIYPELFMRNREKAVSILKKLGDGWRFPTLEELKKINLSKILKGIFTIENHFFIEKTNNEDDTYNSAYVDKKSNKIIPFHENWKHFYKILIPVRNKGEHKKSLKEYERLINDVELLHEKHNLGWGAPNKDYFFTNDLTKITNKDEYSSNEIEAAILYLNKDNDLDKNKVKAKKSGKGIQIKAHGWVITYDFEITNEDNNTGEWLATVEEKYTTNKRNMSLDEFIDEAYWFSNKKYYEYGGELSSKAKSFLEAIQLSDSSIKNLNDITVDATPMGNWSVYHKNKKLTTVNGKLLDEETIDNYDLRHDDEYENGGFVEKTDEELKEMNDDELFAYLDAKAAYMKQYTRPLSGYKAKNFAANSAAIQYQKEGTSKLDEKFPDIKKITEQASKDADDYLSSKMEKGGEIKDKEFKVEKNKKIGVSSPNYDWDDVVNWVWKAYKLDNNFKVSFEIPKVAEFILNKSGVKIKEIGDIKENEFKIGEGTNFDYSIIGPNWYKNKSNISSIFGILVRNCTRAVFANYLSFNFKHEYGKNLEEFGYKTGIHNFDPSKNSDDLKQWVERAPRLIISRGSFTAVLPELENEISKLNDMIPDTLIVKTEILRGEKMEKGGELEDLKKQMEDALKLWGESIEKYKATKGQYEKQKMNQLKKDYNQKAREYNSVRYNFDLLKKIFEKNSFFAPLNEGTMIAQRNNYYMWAIDKIQSPNEIQLKIIKGNPGNSSFEKLIKDLSENGYTNIKNSDGLLKFDYNPKNKMEDGGETDDDYDNDTTWSGGFAREYKGTRDRAMKEIENRKTASDKWNKMSNEEKQKFFKINKEKYENFGVIPEYDNIDSIFSKSFSELNNGVKEFLEFNLLKYEIEGYAKGGEVNGHIYRIEYSTKYKDFNLKEIYADSKNEAIELFKKNNPNSNIKLVSKIFKKGGETTFMDKVKAVEKNLLKKKKVPAVVQKDYGKTYNKKEARESAMRIIGSQTAKWKAKNKMEKGGEIKKVSDKPKFKKLMELEDKARASRYKTKNSFKWDETTGANFRRRWYKMATELRGWSGEFKPLDVKSKPDWIKYIEEQGIVEDYNFGDVLA